MKNFVIRKKNKVVFNILIVSHILIYKLNLQGDTYTRELGNCERIEPIGEKRTLRSAGHFATLFSPH